MSWNGFGFAGNNFMEGFQKSQKASQEAAINQQYLEQQQAQAQAAAAYANWRMGQTGNIGAPGGMPGLSLPSGEPATPPAGVTLPPGVGGGGAPPGAAPGAPPSSPSGGPNTTTMGPMSGGPSPFFHPGMGGPPGGGPGAGGPPPNMGVGINRPQMPGVGQGFQPMPPGMMGGGGGGGQPPMGPQANAGGGQPQGQMNPMLLKLLQHLMMLQKQQQHAQGGPAPQQPYPPFGQNSNYG